MSSYNMHSSNNSETSTNINLSLPDAVIATQAKIKESQDMADTIIKEGNKLQDNGQLVEAMQKYEQALATAPNYWRAFLSQSINLENQGKMEASFAKVQQAYHANPHHHLTNYNFARMYLMGSEDYPAIIKLVKKALELKPDFFQAWVLLAELEVRDNRLDQGLKTIDKALSIEPNNPHAMINKAEYLIQADKKAQAITILESLAHENNRAKQLLATHT